MSMARIWCNFIVCVLACCVFPASVMGEAPKYKLAAFATRDSSVYKIDEEIIFQITLTSADTKEVVSGKELHYEVNGDGGLNDKGTLVSSPEATVRTRLSRPGFVLLSVKLTEDKKVLASADAGAGIEPEKIRSGTEDPADFDEFWQKQIALLRSRTPRILEQEVTDHKDTANAKVFDVRIEDGIVNATGVLALPTYIQPGGLPLYVTFNGASSIGARANIHKLAAANVITFNMNIHDTKNKVTSREEVLEMRKLPAINGYQFINADQKELYAPKTIFLRIIRVLDYLKTRPEWNQKDLIAAGPSFGGAQAVVAAALDPQVNLCLSGAPAMCDHLGERRQQMPGWPKLLSNSRLRKDPLVAAKAAENSAYFDVANFARRVRCETVFGVGFIDRACPPTSVYAAYNNLATTKKQIIHATWGGHGGSSKPGELGAFEVDRADALSKLLNVPVLKNGHFEFIAKRPEPGKKNKPEWQFHSENLPWAWHFNPNNVGEAELCQQTQPQDSGNFLRVSGKNAFVGQSIQYIPTQSEAKISMLVRGEGKLCLRLSGKTQEDCLLELNSPEQWEKMEKTLRIPENANMFWIRVTGRFDFDDIIITPINQH